MNGKPLTYERSPWLGKMVSLIEKETSRKRFQVSGVSVQNIQFPR